MTGNSPDVDRLPITRADARLAELIDMLSDLKVACQLVLPEGATVPLGDGEPAFRLNLRNELLLDHRLTQLSIAEAYVRGDLDVEGDLFALLDLRDVLPAGIPIRQIVRLAGEFLLPATLANARAINHHYSLEDDFYETFLDTKHRFYSQCLWRDGAKTLEDAADRKLATMHSALALEADARVLDIGGGWGGLAAYCVRQGIHVTSLTLTQNSGDTIRASIRKATVNGRVNAEVLVQDFLDHHPTKPYDHVVIFGVIEHIPSYRRFCERVWSVLRPGGCLYLDASATKEKYAASPFTREYTWAGPHSCLALQDMIQELLFAGFEVESVRRDNKDYERTMHAWAERFDAKHDEICERWGAGVYRAFRIFLWGGAHGFARDRLQAYSIVARRGKQAGPRPGRLRRLGHFVGTSVSG